MFEQILGNSVSYLKSTDIVTLTKMHGKEIDYSKLDGCNVVAVNRLNKVYLFKVNPPDRNVFYYDFENDGDNSVDVIDVFKFIQNNCIAWSEI